MDPLAWLVVVASCENGRDDDPIALHLRADVDYLTSMVIQRKITAGFSDGSPGCYMTDSILQSNSKEAQILFGDALNVQLLPLKILVHWNPRLEVLQDDLSQCGGHVAFFFCGHGTLKGEIVLGDGPADPRDLLKPWIEREKPMEVRMKLNCCYGFLVAQLLYGDKGSLFRSCRSLAPRDFQTALDDQLDHLMDVDPANYWLTEEGQFHVAQTALFFGSFDSLAVSCISMELGRCKFRINPTALGPIPSAGLLEHILDCAEIVLEETSVFSVVQKLSTAIRMMWKAKSNWGTRGLVGVTLKDFGKGASRYHGALFEGVQTLSETSEREETPQNSDISVFQFDAGYGESTLLKVGGWSALIDGGVRMKPSEVCFAEQVQYLDRINLVILTHADHDHYNGLFTLLQNASGSPVAGKVHVEDFLLLMPEEGLRNINKTRFYGHAVHLAKQALLSEVRVNRCQEDHSNYVDWDRGPHIRRYKDGLLEIEVAIWANECLPEALQWLLKASGQEIEVKLSSKGRSNVSQINCAGLCVLVTVSKHDETSLDSEERLEKVRINNDAGGLGSDENHGVIELKIWRGLFTGDCRAEALSDLTDWSHRLNYVDVPHHGSLYNWCDGFLDTRGPKLEINAVVGVNTDGGSRHGHPSSAIVIKLEELREKVEKLTIKGSFWQDGLKMKGGKKQREDKDMFNEWELLQANSFHSSEWKIL